MFDERIHGYQVLLIGKKAFQEYCSERNYTHGSEEAFEVFIWTNTSVDLEDEFGLNENGEIQVLNGRNVGIECLKRNAFDTFGIIIRNKQKECIKLVEVELA